MKIKKLLLTGLLVGALGGGLTSQKARAQDDQGPPYQDQDQGVARPDQGPDQGEPQQDPPGRIARMNHVEGSVSFQPGGEGDWLQASPNRPLTSGDNIWADQGSRAELHVGSTVFRMGPETSMTFLDLDDRATQLRLAQGSLTLRVRHLDDDDDFEVDTPNLAFTIRRPGEYRVDVNQGGDTTLITVWRGQGEAAGGGAEYTVLGGQQSRFTGTDQLDHEISRLPRNDDFDRWGFDRDRREDAGVTPNYISPEMTGYEDLDDYGRWTYAAGYGNVWVPAGVAPGWAPYRYGHWAYVGPWGWTWVEDEPWGFAPFHYGRWAYVGASWCWVPGPVVVRPVYAPALVAFVGGVGIAVGGGGPAVGWFPLAPGEVYVPGYRVSRTYVNQVNVTNTRVNVVQVTNVYNNVNVRNVTYVNQRVNNGVTVVPRDAFVNARPVAKSVVQVDQRQVEQAQVVRQAPAQPVRTSVLGAAPASRVRPPAAVERRQVVAMRPPAPARPSFAQQQGNQPHNEIQNTRPAEPVNRGGQPGQPNRPNNAPGAQPGAVQGNRSNEPGQPAAGQPNRPTEPGRPNQPGQVNRPNEPAQPANRPNEQGRPGQPEPTNRPNEVPRPNQPGQVNRPDQGERPPTAPRPENNARPSNEPSGNERPAQQWSHPLAMPMPPQREMTPQQSQQEEQKYRTWQQQQPQRQAPAARQSPVAPPREAPRATPQPRTAPPPRETPKPSPPQKDNNPDKPHRG